jgi:hypothetical protein
MYKYDRSLEESYCIKPVWMGPKWHWRIYLKIEKLREPTGMHRFNVGNFKSDPEDADYDWIFRGPADMCDAETYEQALAYLRENIIAPRIERKRYDDVIIYAPFPEHLPE